MFLHMFHETDVTSSSFVRLPKSNGNILLKLQERTQQMIYHRSQIIYALLLTFTYPQKTTLQCL